MWNDQNMLGFNQASDIYRSSANFYMQFFNESMRIIAACPECRKKASKDLEDLIKSTADCGRELYY